VKLRRHLDQQRQETVDCEELIVEQRQAAEMLEQHVRLARRETDIMLANKHTQLDRLAAAVTKR